MATAAPKSGTPGIYWMNGVSDEEHSLVFVPGVDREVRRRTPFRSGTKTKMRAKRGSDTKAEAPLRKGGKTQGGGSFHSAATGMEHIPSPTSDTFGPLSQVIIETSRAKSNVCLKDLCPEDKRRIANLVQELARVNEEKDESVQRLRDEQGCFERKILQLEQQNLVIAHERESLQQQYRECQELLGLYQQYLSQQREKLSLSIAQLSQPAHSKVLISEEAPCRTSTNRANGSLCDGSYLGLAAHQAHKPPVHCSGGGGGGGGGHSASATLPTSFSCECVCGAAEASVRHHSTHREQHSKSMHRCEHCQGHRAERVHMQHECERRLCGNPASSEAQEALTCPTLGHEDWEHKRHQLLLQKMQLEVEKERLQERLAEQEERLHRQNMQLCQSRMDYSRFQEAIQAELSNSIRNGDPPPQGPPAHHLTSSVRGSDAAVVPDGGAMREERSQTLPAPLHSSMHTEASRRDTATSPVKTPASLRTLSSVPVRHRSPEARLDFSMNELLEVFSPISVPKQRKHSTQSHQTPHSSRRLGSTGPQSSRQDLEESQMLEDIFFIC
ncbi:protein hinderin [Genypterus blacodes]|uniref:protein hinderin n=1 Tax=Genypterus blacodes TaxID=154954 RepID=UPI003F76565F